MKNRRVIEHNKLPRRRSNKPSYSQPMSPVRPLSGQYHF